MISWLVQESQIHFLRERNISLEGTVQDLEEAIQAKDEEIAEKGDIIISLREVLEKLGRDFLHEIFAYLWCLCWYPNCNRVQRGLIVPMFMYRRKRGCDGRVAEWTESRERRARANYFGPAEQLGEEGAHNLHLIVMMVKHVMYMI